MPEAQTRVRLQGFKELASALQALPRTVEKTTARAALRDAAKPLRAGMAQRAARSNVAPHLADNIIVRSVRDKQARVSIAVGPAKRFFYGYFLEKGTSKMAAQPWARPAHDEWRPSGLELLRAGFWKRIQLSARRLARKAARVKR